MNVLVSIIEDDASVRRIFAEWISEAKGFECLSQFGNGEAALARLPELKPDILLVDINLPGMDGIECVRRLKPIMPETQIVMVTVYEDADHIFNALAAGATGYLVKQAGRRELISALRQVQEGGSPMTSYIARKVVQSFHRASASNTEPHGLSPRERQILELLARGQSYKEIADALGITVLTVGTHIRRIYNKLHVRSRGQAVAKYAQFPFRGGKMDSE